MSIATDMGTSCLPVSKASSPSDDLEIDGQHEERPEDQQLLDGERRQPALQVHDPSSAKSSKRS